MEIYQIGQTLELRQNIPDPQYKALILVNATEIAQTKIIPDLEKLLPHTPQAAAAKVCKIQVRRDFLRGTVAAPRHTKRGASISFGFLITSQYVILCDDSGAIRPAVQHLVNEKYHTDHSTGIFFYEFLNQITQSDPRHLVELEEQIAELEDQVLSSNMRNFNAAIAPIRQEVRLWSRYYSQLIEMAYELEADEHNFFTERENKLFCLLSNRLNGLRNETQLLCDYCIQVRDFYHSQVEAEQNRIMKILTIVTTLCLPLSLIVGWYGMNFINMPELSWKFGYPLIIVISVLVTAFSIWIMKKRKFW